MFSYPKLLSGVAQTAAIWSCFTLQSWKPILSDSKIKSISPEELQYHNSSAKGVWVSIGNNVYDITEFMLEHPGGKNILLKYAGKDATELFEAIHPYNVLEKYHLDKKLKGKLEGKLEKRGEANINDIPMLYQVLGISDFEYIAKKVLSKRTWAYYAGGADDNFTLRENHYAFQRIFFNPRVLNNSVEDLDMSTTMLGVKTSAPFYCSAAALAKLGHPDGELSISRACGDEDIFQMISNNSSYSFDEITDEAKDLQSHWFQLYVKPDRKISYDMIKHCEAKGIKGIFITVDSSLVGSRAKDYKLRYDVFEDENEDLNPMTNFKDSGLNWKDILDFKKFTKIPIVIKGVQCAEDVVKAAELNIDGVVLSNHGGRQLDFSRPPLEILAEAMPKLREKGLENKIEVYIDGGVRRGTDIIKALCLGANGVGLGRAFLYANSAYGEAGVKRAIQILKSEVFIGMKLLGVNRIQDLGPELLDLKGLYSRRYHDDYLYEANSEKVLPPGLRD